MKCFINILFSRIYLLSSIINITYPFKFKRNVNIKYFYCFIKI